MTRYDPMTVIPLFIVIIVITGVVYANTSRQKFLNQTLAQQTPHNSPSPDPTPIPTISPTPSATPITTPLATMKATQTPKATIQAQATSQPTNPTDNNSLNQFRYPGGKVTSSSSTSLIIESNDSPDKITDWYKSKIQSLGLNTQSYVVTNTNNNVLNSLAAAGNGVNIKIEIKKNAGDSNTTINVSTV